MPDLAADGGEHFLRRNDIVDRAGATDPVHAPNHVNDVKTAGRSQQPIHANIISVLSGLIGPKDPCFPRKEAWNTKTPSYSTQSGSFGT